MINQSIGGFINFSCPPVDGSSPYANYLGFNSGRNCLAFLVDTLSIKRLFMPYYCCPELCQQVESRCQVEYYHIDENLEPEFIPDNEYFVYINYFGIKTNFIDQKLKKYDKAIIDCCQALYHHPDHTAFYSPRKFLPLANGGLLKCDRSSVIKDYQALPQDLSSSQYYQFLLEDTEHEIGNSERLYQAYKANETEIIQYSVQKMSPISASLLHLIDLENLQAQRDQNFKLLSQALMGKNELSFEANQSGRLIYPWLTRQIERQGLVEQKIYSAQYWPTIHAKANEYEHYLTQHLVALPIDHRYNESDMQKILEVIDADCQR